MALGFGNGIAAVVLLAATVGTAVAARGPGSPAPATVEVSNAGCGRGWTPGPAGPQALRLRDTGDLPADVSVVEPATGAVAGELEALGPGTVRTLRIDLGPGTYVLRCRMEGDDPVTGPRVRVTGRARGGPVVRPVTENELYEPVRAYQKLVTARLDPLVTRVDRLRDAIRDGDRDAARYAWLPAHLAYERLGGAYGAFGDLGDAIDGLPRPDGRGGIDEQDFSGFYRLERGLWHDEPMADLRGPADALARDARELRTTFPEARIDPLDVGLRAHEILEDTERVVLTGRADQGSGTELATAAANLDGTRDVLSVLRPILRTRLPGGLRDLDAWLDRTDRVLSAHEHDGRWTPLDDLSAADRQKVNGAVAGALERLAPVAEICAPRRVS